MENKCNSFVYPHVATHMKKTVYIIIISLLILGCGKKEEKIERTEMFYPDKKYFEKTEGDVIISLDTIESYRRLFSFMDEIACDKKTPVLRFFDKNINYNLLSFIECSQSTSVADYFRRNYFRVENDSIFYDYGKGKRIADFEKVLQSVISKPISYKKYEGDTLKPALIFFYADPEYSIDQIKENLITILSEFDNLKSEKNIDFPFQILFEKRKFPPPPPPPP